MNQTTKGRATSAARLRISLSNRRPVEALVERVQDPRRRPPDEPVLVGHGVEAPLLACGQLALVLLVVLGVHQEAEGRLEDIGYLVRIRREGEAVRHEPYHGRDQ